MTSAEETAVCNLGSVNLGAFVPRATAASNGSAPAGFDFERLGEVVRLVVGFLDRVIDINYYPTGESASSNRRWRPVGLGLMGLQDVFFKLGLAFDSAEARNLSGRISEEIYFNALWASTELAEADGAHPGFAETRAAAGDLQFDLWNTEPSDPDRWGPLRERIAKHGLRNSLLIAIAPTATIAAIAGCYECIEPQVSNLFKRETLSGEFMQVNRYLVAELKARGLWDDRMIGDVKKAEGSIQQIERIPGRHPGRLPHRLEIPQRSPHRDGRRPGRLHRPEPVAQPVHGGSHHREAVVDVHVRVEAGPQDHLLPAIEAGDAHQPDHHQRLGRLRARRRGRGGLLPLRTLRPARRATDGHHRTSLLIGLISRAGTLPFPPLPQASSLKRRPSPGPGNPRSGPTSWIRVST